MGNGHGGARPGAGRKKRPLADKLMEGNPGKRPNKVLGFAEVLFCAKNEEQGGKSRRDK